MSRTDAPRASWIKELAREVRERLAEISGVRFPGVSLVALAIVPTQVLAIELAWRKTLRLYVVHLTQTPDLTVWAHVVENESELLRLLDSLEQMPAFQEEVPSDSISRPRPPEVPTYGALLQAKWEEWLEELRGVAYHEPSGSGSGSTIEGQTFQRLDFQGEDAGRTPAETLTKQLEWAKDWEAKFGRILQQAQVPRTPVEIEAATKAQREAHERSTDWLGTYTTPPIRVGMAPRRALEERIRHRTTPDVADFGKVVIFAPTPPPEFLATDYGFVGVHQRDREAVASWLNLLYGSLYLSGIRCYRVLPSALCAFQFDRGSSMFQSSTVPPSEAVLINKVPRYHRLYTQPQFVPSDLVELAVREANSMTRDDRLPALLPQVLDSRLMLESKDWDHAFFSSWLAVERHVIAEVDAAVQGAKITTKSLKALKGSGGAFSNLETDPSRLRESVAYSINALLGHGLVSQTEWQNLDGLRQKRRLILHPKAKATPSDARDCFRIASGIVEARAKMVLGRSVTPPSL